jgi:hypothetical protein
MIERIMNYFGWYKWYAQRWDTRDRRNWGWTVGEKYATKDAYWENIYRIMPHLGAKSFWLTPEMRWCRVGRREFALMHLGPQIKGMNYDPYVRSYWIEQ